MDIMSRFPETQCGRRETLTDCCESHSMSFGEGVGSDVSPRYGDFRIERPPTALSSNSVQRSENPLASALSGTLNSARTRSAAFGQPFVHTSFGPPFLATTSRPLPEAT